MKPVPTTAALIFRIDLLCLHSSLACWFASPHFINNRDKLFLQLAMLVRIRLKQGPIVQRRRRKNREIAAALAAFLTPSALMCLVLALWKLGSDFQVAGQFVFAEGIFSRWQFWGSGAIGLQAGAWILDRYAFSNRQ